MSSRNFLKYNITIAATVETATKLYQRQHYVKIQHYSNNSNNSNNNNKTATEATPTTTSIAIPISSAVPSISNNKKSIINML